MGAAEIWLVSVLYGLGWAVATRAIAGHLAYAFMEGHNRYYTRLNAPDGAQWSGGVALGAVLALIWPVVLVFALIGHVPSLMVGAEKRHVQAAKQRELEAEIRRLEQFTGVR